jgi:hypothetical protein
VPLTLAQLEALSQRTFPPKAVSRRDPDGYAALHAAIAAAIEPVARALEFDMNGFTARTTAELLDLPPHIFFVWCDDSVLMASFYALPEVDLQPNVAQALHAIAGQKFIKPEQLPPEQWGAALRIMAAIGTPHARDAEDFYNSYVAAIEREHPELPGFAEVSELFDQFAPCFIEDAHGLDRRFSRVITAHRAVAPVK